MQSKFHLLTMSEAKELEDGLEFHLLNNNHHNNMINMWTQRDNTFLPIHTTLPIPIPCITSRTSRVHASQVHASRVHTSCTTAKRLSQLTSRDTHL